MHRQTRSGARSSRAAAAREDRRSVRGYVIVDLLGKGAFGSVYQVRRGERKYAMKELPLDALLRPGQGDAEESHRRSLGLLGSGFGAAFGVISVGFCGYVSLGGAFGFKRGAGANLRRRAGSKAAPFPPGVLREKNGRN